MTVVNSQNITSNLTNDQPVCPGQTITFTCVTRGSPTIEWTSDEYIEDNGPGLQFNELSVLNNRKNSHVNPETFAYLVSKRFDGGVDVLASKLHIVVLSRFSTASVTCIHGNGSRKVESFQVLGMYMLHILINFYTPLYSELYQLSYCSHSLATWTLIK